MPCSYLVPLVQAQQSHFFNLLHFHDINYKSRVDVLLGPVEETELLQQRSFQPCRCFEVKQTSCSCFLAPPPPPSCSLQTLSLDGNHLSFLPEEASCLAQLNSLGLSFNNFSHIPAVLEKLGAVDRLAMAGNRVEGLDLCALARMNHLKNVDLR